MAVEYKVIATVGAIAALCTVVGVLAATFSTYFLIGFGLIAFALVWRFAIAPSKESHARTALVLAQAEQVKMEIKEREARLKNMPAAYEIKPDDLGNYSAFIDPRNNQIAYITPGNAPTRQAGGRRTIREVNAMPELQAAPEQLQIEAPKPAIYKLSDILASGNLIHGNEYLLGFDEDGGAIHGPLFEEEGNIINSAYLAADQSGGKSAAATLLAALTVSAGGSLLVIDPDSQAEQSLTNRLGPLNHSAFMLEPIGSDPASAMKVLRRATEEFNNLDGKPITLIVDEATAIFAAEFRETPDEWTPVAATLRYVAELYANRGRKRRRRVLLLGQGAKVTRVGGSEVRDSLTTLAFKFLKKKKAVLVLEDSDLAERALTLEKGQCVFIPDRSDIVRASQHFVMKWIYADLAGLEAIAAEALRWLQSEITEDAEYYEEEAGAEPVDIQYNRHKQLVKSILAENPGATVAELIRRVYHISKGASPDYTAAREEMKKILTELNAPQSRRMVQ